LGFHDYEILELLLTLGTPRRDCKEQAKEAIKKFKTLHGVLKPQWKSFRRLMELGHITSLG
jgi:DNA repair protein RadC